MSSPQILFGVNTTLFLVFLSRGLYTFGTMFQVYLLPDIPLQADKDVAFVVFLTFMLWDYLPTTLIVVVITSRSLGSTGSRTRRLFSNNSIQWHTYVLRTSAYVQYTPELSTSLDLLYISQHR
jgi:hypothetical protein